MPHRISAATAPRITRPTYEKLSAELKAVEKKLTTATKALADHRHLMMRARYTPEGYKQATAKLKTLEKEVATLQKQKKALEAQLAVLRPAPKPPSAAKLTAVIERHLAANDLQFGAKAPKKEDILTQTTVNKHPFSYTAIVLKSDPTHVIIKKVLTGGFVPARPGDGSYSKPVPLTP